jgi:beta-N-acetylhexosaminidase
VTNLPASLSSAVIQGLLRQQLGFTGLVLTDSLSAGAVTKAGYTIPAAAAAAITAGADQILFGSTLTEGQTNLLAPTALQQATDQIIQAIVDANLSGALSTAQFNQAVAQVIEAKGVNLCG